VVCNDLDNIQILRKAVDNLEIDTDPEGQRTDQTEEDKNGLIGSNSKPSKAQGVINTIFKGNDIGEIKLTTNGYTFEKTEDGKDIILENYQTVIYLSFWKNPLTADTEKDILSGSNKINFLHTKPVK
jgi:hypothetical protein